MKHVIVEGCDRTGKDTLIHWLTAHANNYTVRHFTKPVGKTLNEKRKYQIEDFDNEFFLATNKPKEKQTNDLYIWNRSHIGEYVYGQMYRDSESSWIFDMEQRFNFHKRDDIYLILLYAEPEFLIKREDGHSLSTNLEDRKQEIKLFLEAIDKSNIKHKLTIKVNDGDNYIPKEVIQNQVQDFLQLI